MKKYLVLYAVAVTALFVCSHRRYRCGLFCSVAGKVADYRDIRCVEQLLEYRRCRYRQSEPRQLVPYRAVQHVELV